MRAGALGGQRGHRPCRNRVTGDYEAPDIESENQTLVFSKSNKHP